LSAKQILPGWGWVIHVRSDLENSYRIAALRGIIGQAMGWWRKWGRFCKYIL